MTTGSAFIEPRFRGILIAPNGPINIGAANEHNQTFHDGAFFGNAVTLFENQGISYYRDPSSFRGFGPRDGSPSWATVFRSREEAFAYPAPMSQTRPTRRRASPQ